MMIRVYVYQSFSKWPIVEKYPKWTDIYLFWSVIRVIRGRAER